MARYVLIPHPDFPCDTITAISVKVEEKDGGLSLAYHVAGSIDDVVWPPPGAGGRADRLWEHSCFEAFLGGADGAGYTEVNLATSGHWAAYDFDDYRAGMRPVEQMTIAISFGSTPDMMSVEASIYLPVLSDGREWQLNLAAIIEAKDGTKSYWALAHPPGKPDFHNRDCFTARLAAPTRP